MLRYIFVINFIVLTLSLQSVSAQSQGQSQSQSQQKGTNKQEEEDDAPPPPKDPIVYQPLQDGIAFGIDLAPLMLQLSNPARKGFNFTGKINFKQDWFAVAEVGYENFNYHSAKYNYLSNGTGVKIGFDYNVFHPDELGNNDNVFFGARYGFAWQQQSSSKYTIVNGYWTDYTGSFAKYGLTSHYVECLFGLRTEVFKNLFMGFSLRGEGLLYTENKEILKPTSIPGYGNPNPLNFGFSYNLEYRIPYFWKKKKTVTNEKLL